MFESFCGELIKNCCSHNYFRDSKEHLHQLHVPVLTVKKAIRLEESCPINDVKGKVIGRTCQACRNATIRLRCSALKCTTPIYKLKHLKSNLKANLMGDTR